MKQSTSLVAAPVTQPHSAGKSLGVLVGAIATLWVWWQIPNWYRLGSEDATTLAALQHTWQQPWLVMLCVTSANAVVLLWATLPLALPSSPASLLDRPRYVPDRVFWLCILLHLVSVLGF